MSILYKVFPMEVSGFGHSPKYSTTITVGASGSESRNINWADALREYDLRFTIRAHADVYAGLHFFHTCHARGYGFLIKDLADYNFADQAGNVAHQILTGLIPADGSRTQFQIFKIYQDSLSRYVRRDIKFPIPNTWEVKVNNVTVTNYQVELSTGIIHFNIAPTAGVEIKVKCEFYVPVRFGNDSFPSEALLFALDEDDNETRSLWQIEAIPLVELRYEEVIGAPELNTAPAITTASLPDGYGGVAYNHSISWTGGNAPFTVSVVDGALPDDWDLGTVSGHSVPITGTETTLGDYEFTIQVLDADGQSDERTYPVSIVEEPTPYVNVVFHGDSTIANTDIPSWATNNIAAKVQAVLGAGYTCTNCGVGGGGLNLSLGDNRDLIATADTVVDIHYDPDAIENILFIKSWYNDIFGEKTLAQYRDDLETYIAQQQAVGWKVVVVAPGTSDYPGQRAYQHKRRLDWLEILASDWQAMGADGIVNYSGSNLIGTEANTHSTTLWLDKLHPAAAYNTEAAPYYAQAVKVIDGTAVKPSKPTFAVKSPSSTSIQISRDDKPDSYAVTSYQYRIDGGSAVSMALTNPLTISSLTAGTEYEIEVRAVGSGNSDWADVKTVTTKPTGAWDMGDLSDSVWLNGFYEDVARTNPATADGNDVLAVGDANGSDHFSDTTVGATHGATLQLSEIGDADALQFVGNVSDYSKLVNDTLGDDLTGSWALAFGFQMPFAINDSGIVFMWGDLSTGERRGVGIDPFAPGILEFSGYAANLSSETGVADNNPHWILIVRDGTLITIYIDGEKIVSGRPVLNAYSSSGVCWGGNYQDLTELFYGFTTEVAIKKSAPTAVEIHRMNDYGLDLLGL